MQSCQSLAMEMESSASHQEIKRAGLLTRAWGCFKGLIGNLKNKVVNTAKSVKKLGEDDPRRITHSLKVGVAVTLVSLLYFSRTLYDSFGVAGMWAVLTVVVVFEFTVGGTLLKSLNRGFATLLAGALGVGAHHLASLFGNKGEPIVIGILVFLLASASTFSRFIPKIKARYDYGVLIFILTFSLVSVSGVRVDELVEVAHQRLSTIIIGGAACIVISIGICPVWAGEDLHKLVASNIEKLGNYLEGFGKEYFVEDGTEDEIKTKNKSFLEGYKSVLNSKSAEDSMANLALWEPRHGKFGFRHPWKQYLKIGAISRQCAYHIEALNGCINSNIQAPEEFKSKIQEPCKKMSEESGKALKLLSSAIKTMTDPSPAKIHVDNSKTAINELKIALKSCSLDHDDLLIIVPAATVASTLTEIVQCVDKLSESVHELANLAHFKIVEATVSPEKPQLLHRGTVNPVLDRGDDHVVITIEGTDSPENNHDDKNQATKMPSRQNLQV
ncbi:aluminum-activated malate transporter 8 [Mercurialis annua]|uniref:aluminum-activated malate transporter 8 n=1 Tax=Mercurialis annua TaxID=3986 RepID=UPI002160B085|nr:aluminum-activated malate transporter 8 [Mercurialis annua]